MHRHTLMMEFVSLDTIKRRLNYPDRFWLIYIGWLTVYRRGIIAVYGAHIRLCCYRPG